MKPDTRFRLVPQSTTLDDLELTLSGHYAFLRVFYVTHLSFEAHHENTNEHKTHTISGKNVGQKSQFLAV